MAITAAVLARSAPAQAESSAEQATKAAVVYNFSRFAVWPPDRFAGPAEPVVLCVSPSASLAEPLLRLSGQPVGSRTLNVRLTSRFDRSCHMAYLAERDANSAELAELKARGILTVGEGPQFLNGGTIQMVTIGRQVRFAINQQNASQAGVKLSSNLLRLAVAVR